MFHLKPVFTVWSSEKIRHPKQSKKSTNDRINRISKCNFGISLSSATVNIEELDLEEEANILTYKKHLRSCVDKLDNFALSLIIFLSYSLRDIPAVLGKKRVENLFLIFQKVPPL